MKIVIFTDSYWPRINGVAVSVESFAVALRKAGHEILIICPFYPQFSQPKRLFHEQNENESKIPDECIIRVPSTPLFLSKEDRLSKSHKLFWVSRHIDKFAPDIIHIQSEFVTANFGHHCARTRKIPSVYTYHTMWIDYMNNYLPHVPTFILNIILWFVESYAFRSAYRVIIPNPIVMNVVKKYKLKKEPYLLPTGIDKNIFCNEDDKIKKFRELMDERYPAIKNKKILLFAGRIGREKNIEFLFHVAPAVIAKYPEVIFLIVGDGPDMFWYKAECMALGVYDHFIFIGYIDRKDLSLTYAISDIFVFPSMSETQGLVTIEAMISGLPVVAIGAGGTIYVMNGDNGGFMVKNDTNVFTEKILDLLEDKDLYKKKCLEAKEYAKSWTIDIMVRRLENIYEETINDYKKEPLLKAKKRRNYG